MKIGDKLILTSNPLFFNKRDTYKYRRVDKTIVIEVVDVKKNVPGVGKIRQGRGYIAKGSDGFKYSYNYPVIYLHNGAGVWTRYAEHEAMAEMDKDTRHDFLINNAWHEISFYKTQTRVRFTNLVFKDFPADGLETRTRDFVDFCQQHSIHFYKRDECPFCKGDEGKIEHIKEI